MEQLNIDFRDLLEYGNCFYFDMETKRNIVHSYLGITDNKDEVKKGDQNSDLLFNTLLGICPSVSRLLKDKVSTKYKKLTDEEVEENLYILMEGESNGCSKYTVDEYPLDLLWCGIITSDNIEYLSDNDVYRLMSRYTDCKRSNDVDILKRKILERQLILLGKTDPIYRRCGNIVEALIEDNIKALKNKLNN